MYVGTQIEPRDDSDYQVWAQLGITHVCVDPPGSPDDWDLDALRRHKDHVNVHFRNIRGRRLDFVETFPDEGDMDMARSLATYREVGYQYMLMPDHVPRIAGRDPLGVAFAYCYGYIQGLLDAL